MKWDDLKPVFDQHAELAARPKPPEKPEGYKAELPSDFEIPKDLPFKINEDDPRWGQARALAHEMGLSQDQFGKLMTLEASRVISQAQQTREIVAAETKKLGPKASERVTAVKTFLTGILGTKPANNFLQGMVLSSDIEALELLARAYQTQGGARPNANGRDDTPTPAPRSVAERWYPNLPSAGTN